MPVKNQNGTKPDVTTDIGATVGLCRAVSALNSMESNILKQDIVSDPSADEANLSPSYIENYIGYNNPCHEHKSFVEPGVEPVAEWRCYFPDSG
jgi:hypothetical protein